MGIILASSSPRRFELLRNAGIAFRAQAADIAEIPIAGESPWAFVMRLAEEKARVIFKNHAGEYVLGADTIVAIDDEILGKPRDVEDAKRMLRLLSGQTHEVITGVCLMGPGFEDVRYEQTRVFMSSVTDEEIRQYVDTREPMDKAGAYAIQGTASRWIYRIEGDYFNVVGLPVSLVHRVLLEHGAMRL